MTLMPFFSHIETVLLLAIMLGLSAGIVTALERDRRAAAACRFAIHQLTDVTLQELRLPLQSIHLQLMQLHNQLTGDDRLFLQHPLDQCQEMTELINDLWLIARVRNVDAALEREHDAQSRTLSELPDNAYA